MRSLSALMFLALQTVALAADAATSGVPLVVDGRPAASIVLPDQASATLTGAAQEIVAYVEKMTGTKLAVGPAGADQARVLFEIDSKSIAEEDAFRIVARGREVRLIGGPGRPLALSGRRRRSRSAPPQCRISAHRSQ